MSGDVMDLLGPLDTIVAQQTLSSLWMAVHPSLGKLAVKQLRLENAQSEEERADAVRALASERSVLQLLSHPRIPKYYGEYRPPAKSACANPAFVETFFKACPLHRLHIDCGRRVRPDFVADVVVQLSFILEHIHHQGIIFVDLKLPNVLVDVDGRVFLVDFGHARLVTDSSRDTRRFGTMHLRAPELFADSGMPTRLSDIFALGMLTFELAFGEPPLGGFDVCTNTASPSVAANLAFPEGVRAESQQVSDMCDLICSLVASDPAVRLGSSCWNDVRSHPFLSPCSQRLLDHYPSVGPYAEEIEMQTLGL